MTAMESLMSLLAFAEKYHPELLDRLIVDLVVMFQTTGRGW